MFKKLAVIFTVLTIVSMLLVPIAFAADNDVVSISITQNKSFYIGEDAEGVKLTVIGTREDGTTVDVSDKISWPFTLDGDKSVFYFNGYKLCSTGKTGKAIIRVPYKNEAGTTLTADMVVVRQNATTDAGQPIAPITSANYTVTGEAGSETGGHFDGDSFGGMPNNWSVRLAALSYATNDVPSEAITNRWFDSGYRSMAAWFYDDGTDDYDISAYATKLGFASIQVSDSILFHKNFEADYGYGEFAEKWKGMKSYRALYANFETNLANSCYTTGTNFASSGAAWSIGARSKGWHQLVISLEKNADAEYGWTVYTYLDGKLIGNGMDVVPTTDERYSGPWDQAASLEMRANVNANKTFYYDDMVLMGSLETEDTSKTLTGAIGENGSVTVNGEDFANGATVKLEEGDDINIAVTPNTGYEVDEVKLDGTAITLNASGAATATMPGEDVTLTVTFKAKTVTAPTIITDTSINYFKTVDGKPTAFVYAKIGDYYDPSLNGGYGMKLWVDGDAEHFITLPAMADETSEAVAAPNTAFAIKVYGNAITADNTYVFKPYVGETEGDEIKVSFTE